MTPKLAPGLSSYSLYYHVRRLFHPYTVAAIVFVIAAIFSAAIIWRLETLRLQAARTHVLAMAAGHAQALQRNLERALSATYALATLVRQGNGRVDNFDLVAHQMLELYPGAGAIGLAPNGVVRHIVPLAGNEKSIGHDMLRDPARATEAMRALGSGELTLAGPFNLVQGGLGAVARLPVFLGADGKRRHFWGFTTVLLRFPEALSSARLSQLSAEHLAYELWRRHPDTGSKQVIATSAGNVPAEPVDHVLAIANTNWTLSVAPAHGWDDPAGMTTKAALGLAVSAMLAFVAKLLAEQKAHKSGLQELVRLRTADITTTKRQLQAAMDAIPDLMLELGLDGACYDWHHSARSGAPFPARRSSTGMTVADMFSASACDVIMQALTEAHASGYCRGQQFKHGEFWLELSISRKNHDEAGEPRFIVLARDISERKAAESHVHRLTRLYAALSHCNQAIVRSTSEAELLQQICAYAVEFGGMAMAWIGFADQATQRLIPIASHGDSTNYLDNITISMDASSPYGHGASGTAVRTDQPTWCQDFQADPHNAPWMERGAQAGWGGTAALPLHRDGVVVGVFALYTREANAFDDAARQLLVQMAADISFAMDNFARKAERRRAELALRESQTRLQAVTHYANDAIITADCGGSIVSWNRGAETIFGYAAAEACGQSLTMLMPPRYREQHEQGMRRVLAGEAARMAGNTIELAGVRKDGTEFPIELSMAKWDIDDGSFFTGFVRDITKRKNAEGRLQLAAQVFKQSNEGITITDAERNIVLVNHAFTDITGFGELEVIGRNPRLLSSGSHDQAFYRRMWASIDANGYWEGEVWNRRKDGGVYLEWLSITSVRDSDDLVTNYIGIFSDITRQKVDEERIRNLAHFDPLTGLANRVLLSDRVQQAIEMAKRNAAPLALLILDLDNFKNVNDSLGHTVGDRLLVEIAARLKATVRAQDTLARLGGDEFILVLPDTDADGAAHVAEKLLATVAQLYQIGQHELVVTPSVGIAMFPGDGTNYDTLFKCADTAMYRAKRDGRNLYRFFTSEMQDHAARTLLLESALRNALKRDQFMLHYQPQVSLQTGAVIGAEALLRWQHPELGLVPPAEFIPIAEASGLILPIGEWVLRTAARQCKQWLDQGLPSLRIAVNLSAVQFRHAGLPERISQILDEEQLSPQYLELELTETVAMDDPVMASTVMQALHARGLRMAIDDFGTGYSSLSYLKRFQVYKLKIDRSFVRDLLDDPDDRAIVHAIIGLARSLGLDTIAEGVETEGQLAFLRASGCAEVQGYCYSPPLPAVQFVDFVEERNLSNAS